MSAPGDTTPASQVPESDPPPSRQKDPVTKRPAEIDPRCAEIRRRRLAASLTQASLGTLAGLAPVVVRRCEHGQPKGSELKRLERTLTDVETYGVPAELRTPRTQRRRNEQASKLLDVVRNALGYLLVAGTRREVDYLMCEAIGVIHRALGFPGGGGPPIVWQPRAEDGEAE